MSTVRRKYPTRSATSAHNQQFAEPKRIPDDVPERHSASESSASDQETPSPPLEPIPLQGERGTEERSESNPSESCEETSSSESNDTQFPPLSALKSSEETSFPQSDTTHAPPKRPLPPTGGSEETPTSESGVTAQPTVKHPRVDDGSSDMVDHDLVQLDTLDADPFDSSGDRSQILDAQRGDISSNDLMSDSPTSPSLQQQISPSQSQSSAQPWFTIQSSSMFLNTMSPQSHESDDGDVVLDDNSNGSALHVKQHHLVVADSKQGCTTHPVVDATTTTPHPSPYTRKYFTLCSLEEYLSRFILTGPNSSKNAKTPAERVIFQDLYSRFPSITRPVTMTLYFLYHAPQIYLPLAPFRHAIFSAVELACICEQNHLQSVSSFDNICRLVSGILSMRIWHAVSGLYADLKPYPGDSIPQVEHDKPMILEWLARDTLAAFNPIEIMLIYYRPIMAEFQQIANPTSEDRLFYFRKVQDIVRWLIEMRPICIMYGLHIHDSQWVSMDEWRELAGYMNIVSTQMAPDVFQVVQGNHPAPTNEEDEGDLICAKDWYESFVECIAPCFTHHYRPMDDPRRYKVPYGDWPSSVSVQCQFTPAAYIDLTTNLPTALEHYATMYVEDPQQFECEGSQAVSLIPNGNPNDITPSSIGPAFREMIKKTQQSFETNRFDGQQYRKLTLKLPSYSNGIPQIQHLIRAIVDAPPVGDPVYELFAPWFTHVTDHLRVMQPAPDSWVPPDPQFAYDRHHQHNHRHHQQEQQHSHHQQSSSAGPGYGIMH